MYFEKSGKSPSKDIVSLERALREGYFAVIYDDVKRLLGREPRSVWDIFLEHKALYNFD
jgi:NAD(P)H dehydrogenase (quinone)